MRALFHILVARIRDFLRPAGGEADFDQELELHLAMAEEDSAAIQRGELTESPGGPPHRRETQARRSARAPPAGGA